MLYAVIRPKALSRPFGLPHESKEDHVYLARHLGLDCIRGSLHLR